MIFIDLSRDFASIDGMQQKNRSEEAYDALIDQRSPGFVSNRLERAVRLVLRELLGSTFDGDANVSEQTLADAINRRYGHKLDSSQKKARGRPPNKLGELDTAQPLILRQQVREACIFLEGRGLLTREQEGIARLKISEEERFELFALRLEDELFALQQLMSEEKDEDRRFIVDRLREAVDYQRVLSKASDELSRMRFVEAGIDFHVAICRLAGLHFRSRRLRNCLYRLRIGSFATFLVRPADRLVADHVALLEELTRLVEGGRKSRDKALRMSISWATGQIYETASAFFSQAGPSHVYRPPPAVWKRISYFLPADVQRLIAFSEWKAPH